MTIRSAFANASVPGMFDSAGRDIAGLGVDSKKDGTLEAMMLGHDACQSRQRLFRLILVVAGDEDDLFRAFAKGQIGSFIDLNGSAASKVVKKWVAIKAIVARSFMDGSWIWCW